MKIKKISLNLYLLFAVSIVIPYFCTSLLFSYFYSNMSTKHNNENIENILISTSENIKIYFNELNSISKTPYLYSDILQTMKYINRGDFESSEDYYKLYSIDRNYSILFTKLMYNAQQNVKNVAFFPMNNDCKNAYLVSRNAAGIQVYENYDYQKTDWFTQAIKANGDPIIYPIHQVVYDETHNEDVFSLVRAIKDVDTKKIVGIIKIDSNADTIRDVLNKINVSSNSAIILTTPDNNIVVKNTNNKIFNNLFLLDEFPESDLKFYNVSKNTLSNYKYKLVYFSSKNDSIRYLVFTYILIVITSVVTIIFSFLVYKFRSSQTINSINNIVNTLKRIEHGDLSVRASVKSKDELLEICNALNHMIKKLDQHITQEYKATICQREAEYTALQSQINPHFLYNTLNGFIALNRMGEKEQLENSIIQLTHLFRYTCSNGKVTSVKEEINFIQKYLELQKLKYDERLEFIININEEANDIVIPRLLLQPIIENSIVHGLEPTDNPILINILVNIVKIKSIGNCALFYIKDNGVGFNMNQIDDTKKHIGINNIQQRLEYFNSETIFNIYSVPNKGTECTIIIKLND